MNTELQPVLLSVKPRFADLIFDGLKKAELRRRFLKDAKDRDVFIYVTSPERELRGGFRVGQIWCGTPDDVWNKVQRIAKIEKSEYDAYYADSRTAYALSIKGVWQCDSPMNFQTLKCRFPEFMAPRSWRYVRLEEYEFFMSMKRKAELCSVHAA